MAYCKANTKAGKQCTAQAMAKALYCYRHNPDIPADQKRQASVEGGKKRQALADQGNVNLREIRGIVELLEQNTDAVRRGELDPKINNAVVQNINALLKVYELAVVDGRIRKLEQQAGIDSPEQLVDMGAN